MERIFYGRRPLNLAATGQGLVALIEAMVWFARRQPKLFVACLVSLSILFIFGAFAHIVKSSQASFFARAPITAPSNHSQPATSEKIEPITTTQPAPMDEATALPSPMPASLPPFFEVGDNTAGAQAIARSMNAARFGDQHWSALQQLWQAESGWNPEARNPSSGACGIPQALPCSKIPDMSLHGQLEWGIDYIGRRYGSPSNAWNFWQNNHWY